MAADQRVADLALVGRAGVLQRLAAVGVLVGSADAREAYVEHDGARLGLGPRELAQLDSPGTRHDRGGDAGHDSISASDTQRSEPAARSSASQTAWTRAPWPISGVHGPSGHAAR